MSHNSNNVDVPYKNDFTNNINNEQQVYESSLHVGLSRSNNNNVVDSSSLTLLKKCTGLVMHVAKMPFRSVKRRFIFI